MTRLKWYGFHKESGLKPLPDDKALSKNIHLSVVLLPGKRRIFLGIRKICGIGMKVVNNCLAF
jgi:hypothetical protein